MQLNVSDENAHVLSEVHTDCQFRVLTDKDFAVTRFKITFHEFNTKSESSCIRNRPAVKSETNETLQTEFNLKDTESDTRFEHVEENASDPSNCQRNEEIFDEDGDLILDRNVCKSRNHILDETCDCTLNRSYFTNNDHVDHCDENICVTEKLSEEVPVKKKIKLEEFNARTCITSISSIEDKFKSNSDCYVTENTFNDDLVQGIQSSVVACRHCGLNNECQGKSINSDTSEKHEFVVSDRLVNDGTNLCGICVKNELPGERIKKENTMAADSHKKFREVIDDSDDNDSAIYYININHSLSTELDNVGEQVWHGSLLLSDYIICNHSHFENKVVIDLGAGVGLSSIVAAMYAKMVYCTDTGEKILSLADGNILPARTCPTLPRKLCDIHVRELDWFKGLEEDTCKFGLTKDDIDRINKSDILIAADVIYDFDITDAFFSVVKQIMSHAPCKTLYIGLEKRIVFTCEDLTVTSPGYNYFRLHLNDLCSGEDSDTEVLFEATQIQPSFPQLFQYNRIKQLELWRITASFKS